MFAGNEFGPFRSLDLLEPVGQTNFSKLNLTKPPPSLKDFYQKSNGIVASGDIFEYFDLSRLSALGSDNEFAYQAYSLRKGCHQSEIDEAMKPEWCSQRSTFEDLRVLLWSQATGNSGFLVNNGYPNIFLMNDRLGERRAVSASWFHHGSVWCLNQQELKDDEFWEPGTRFIFPQYLRKLFV